MSLSDEQKIERVRRALDQFAPDVFTDAELAFIARGMWTEMKAIEAEESGIKGKSDV